MPFSRSALHKSSSDSSIKSRTLASNESQKASAAQRTTLNLLVHRSNTKIFSTDVNGVINSWSDSMTSFTGIPSNIAIYTSAADIFINENAIVVTVINSALSGEEYLYKRISLNTEHGSRKVVLNAMPRYSDNQIDIEGTACVLWDVTLLTEKEINDLIALDNRYREDFNSISRDMQKLAEELEMKGNFVRSVSHEIRTPLNVVMAGLQLIETQFKNEISPEVLALIEEIEQSCRDGVNILDDLLAYEKIEGRVLAVERQPISVTQLVKTCIHPFQMQARLTNVNMIYSESLNVGNMTTICQDFIIFVDQFKTMQVVRNLISNAIKFTRDGKVECRVSWTEKSVEPLLENNNKGFVRIEVIDNGIGLSEENQAKLFKEVIQFDAAANQSGGGSGLGLYVSQSLVALNGGAIGVESKGIGQGSMFYVEYPLFEAIYSREATGDDLASRRQSKEWLKPDFRILTDQANENSNDTEKVHARLLIVDDSTLSRRMVAQLLRPQFAEIIEATDGVDALKKYQIAESEGTPFHVILMDSEMPKMGGMEATSELRKLGYMGALIGLTGYGEQDKIEEYMSHGTDHVLVKPIQREEFLRITTEILSKKRMDPLADQQYQDMGTGI